MSDNKKGPWQAKKAEKQATRHREDQRHDTSAAAAATGVAAADRVDTPNTG